MFCARCGARVSDSARFCTSCGMSLAELRKAAEASESVSPDADGRPDAENGSAANETATASSATKQADRSERDQKQDRHRSATQTASRQPQQSTAPQSVTFREMMLQSHRIGRLMVPTFAIIIASLIASIGIGVAVTIVYRHTNAATEAPAHAKRAENDAQSSEDADTSAAEEEPNADDADEEETGSENETAESSTSDAGEDATGATDEQRTAMVAAPDDSTFAEVDTAVPSSYDAAADAGTWRGTFVDRDVSTDKSGSYEEASWACGQCYGAKKRELKLTITSVDTKNKTASGTVSFLWHNHTGPIDTDIESDAGDTYVENAPFKNVSIEGWRTNGCIDLYSANGKTVQMSLRLRYGSADDYSVWIRTVPAAFEAQGLTYQWGQTDMYTLTRQ